MTRQEIKDVRRTLKKFPDKEDFLRSLYPEAFKEKNVSDGIVVELNKRIYSDGVVDYFTITLIYQQSKLVGGKKTVIKEVAGTIGTDIEKAYYEQVEPDFNLLRRSSGFRVIRYGKI